MGTNGTKTGDIEHMDRPANSQLFSLVGTAVFLDLVWMLSVAHPCLIAIARGGEYSSANPIAITECSVSTDGLLVITVGDVVMRLAALALLMGLFGFVIATMRPLLTRRRLAWIAAAGTICAFAVYVIVEAFLVPWASSWVDVVFCIAAAVVASLAVMAGVNVARPAITQ